MEKKELLKILNLNLNNIAIYDYKKTLYINNLLNNDYDYFITIDYANKQLNIDIYKKNSHNILYNIHISNKDAFDAILNKDNNYSIIKINKYAVTF